MPADMIVNPFASISDTGVGGSILIAAPKRGEGLKIANIRPSENPKLYELFKELSIAGIGMMDVDADLDDDEREYLEGLGVLVEPGHEPQKPLYSCPLDEIAVPNVDGTPSSAVASPSLRFEPFNLANFRNLIAEKNFSPYMATAWVVIPEWGLESVYWLTNEQASVVSRLIPGEKAFGEIDRALFSKLLAARIVTNPETIEKEQSDTRSKIDRAMTSFGKNGYVVLRDVIPQFQIKALQTYYRSYIGEGFMMFGDPLVSRRYREPNEPLARTFHESMTGLMSKLAGEDVKPSYCYASSYVGGADLRPHIDRPMCEYSFSVQVDYQPLADGTESPWALNLSTEKFGDEKKYSLLWDDLPAGVETEKAIHLVNGDVLAYRGCDLAHYRRPLHDGHTSTSLFFHYVPLDFTGDLM